MRPFYLQLHFDVWDDPAIRLFPASWRCAIVDLMKYAVRSSEPGFITIGIPQLARLLGFRKLARFENFLDELEARRLIAYRKDDDAIALNPDLLPQLLSPNSPSPEFPRRRKPSDQPEATRERKRMARQRVHQLPLIGPDVTPLSRPPQPDNITCESEPENQTAEQQQPDRVTPTAPPAIEDDAHANADVAPSAAQKEISIRLMAAGVTARVALDLIQRHGEAECAAQLAYLPHRELSAPAGALVRAIAEKWQPPDAWKREQQSRQHGAATERARIDRTAVQEAIAQSEAARAEQLAAAKDAMTVRQHTALQDRAAERLTPAARELLKAGKHTNPLLRAELDAAEWDILQETSAK